MNAPITLLMYSDFQCALCAQLASAVQEVVRLHPGEIRTVFRLYPLLAVNDKSSLAGQAAFAAGAQGAFWVMHDLLFGRQEEWLELSPMEFEEWLLAEAHEHKLDGARFEEDLRDRQYQAEVEAALPAALESGLPGVPFLFLNGQVFRLAPQLLNLEAAIRLELLRTAQFGAFPPMSVDPEGDYLARLMLNKGELVIQLYPDSAPLAVNSFIFLAEAGWYDGSPVHRVLPGVLVEAGDPSGTGLGGPGYHFPTELDARLQFDRPGVVAMVSTGPDLNGSQFLIALDALPHLNGARTIFGQVLSGLDLIRSLGARDPFVDLLLAPEAVIMKIEIEGPDS